MSQTFFAGSVPIYNAHDLPDGLNSSALKLAQDTKIIASFDDEHSLESFCADLSIDSSNTCSCETKEEEIKEALIICTVPVLEAFIEAEDEKGRKLPVFIEPDAQQKALSVFGVQEYNYTALIQDAVKRGSMSIWGIDRIDDGSHKDGTYNTKKEMAFMSMFGCQGA